MPDPLGGVCVCGHSSTGDIVAINVGEKVVAMITMLLGARCEDVRGRGCALCRPGVLAWCAGPMRWHTD